MSQQLAPSTLSPAVEEALAAAFCAMPSSLTSDVWEAAPPSEAASTPRFESLVESLPGGVWTLRGDSVVYANPAAARLLGVDRFSLEGHDFLRLCHPQDAAAVHNCLADVQQHLLPRTIHARLLTGEGQERPLILTVVFLPACEELTLAVFGQEPTGRGLSERALLQADRVAALGLLAGGMAHALNNPLTYILLNLDHVGLELHRLENEPSLVPDVLARVAEAREGAERMAAVVRRMHLFSRTHETEPTLVSLRAVLNSVVDLLGHEIRHRGQLTTQFDDDVAQILAHKSWVEQICLRLLLFAALHLPEESSTLGGISLKLRSGDHAKAELEVLCENAELTPSDVPELASLAQSPDPSQDSRTSLAVCQQLVNQLGGHLAVELVEGQGLWVRVSLPTTPPTSEEALPPSAQQPLSIPPQAMCAGRIMVIDDEPEVAQALKRMLEDEHRVECYTDPRQALRVLLADPSFDVVFCDVMMPTVGGPEVYEILRFNRPGYESRVVFMSGGAFDPKVQRFLAKLPNPRMDKPFNLRMIRRLVEEAVQKHKSAVE